MRRSLIVRTPSLLLVAAMLIGAGQPGPDRDRERRGPPPGPVDSIRSDAYDSTYRPLPRQDLAIVNARILDGAGGRIDGGTVVVREGQIVSVAAGGAAPAEVQIIDAKGAWLTPGIIDIHSHNGTFVTPLTANDSEYSDVSEISAPIAAGVWVEHSVNVQDPGFRRALEAGVTTLQILPGSIPLIGGRTVVLKNVPATTVRQMKFPGVPQGVKMSCGDNPRSHFGSKGQAPNSRMGSMKILREFFARGRSREPQGRGPPPDDLAAQTMAGIFSDGLKVHVHCYRAEDMAQMLALANEYDFEITAFHHATEAYKIRPLFRQSGACAVVWADWWGFKTEAADGVRANAALMDRDGLCVAMHSDSPIMGQYLNLEAAKAMAAGRRAGIAIAPERAIRWITSAPAVMLGIGDRVGTIAPGRNADLVLWSGDPFSVYSSAEKVFIDGALAFDRSDPTRQPVSDFELGRPTSGRAQ